MKRIRLEFLFLCALAMTSPAAGIQRGEDGWKLRQQEAQKALQSGRYADAVPLFLDAVQQAEQLHLDGVRLAESLNGLAQSYRYQQKHAEAESTARRALGILEDAFGPTHENLIPSLVNLAHATQSRGDHASAEEFYRRILSIRSSETVSNENKDTLDALENYADVLTYACTKDPRLQTALAKYRPSVVAGSLKKGVYVVMKDGLLAAELGDEAEMVMQHAVQTYPESRELRYQLADLYGKTRQYEKAVDALKVALRVGKHPDPEKDRQQRVMIYERIAELDEFVDRFDDAFAASRAAVSLDPNNPETHQALGGLYLSRMMLGEAAAEYRAAISLSPDLAQAHYGLAQAALDRGSLTEAAEEASKAIRLQPTHEKARYVLGMALIRSGRTDEGKAALAEYERREIARRSAEAGQKEFADAEKSVSERMQQGRLQEAADRVTELIRRQPAALTPRLQLGLVQGRLGLHREAIKTYETIIELGLSNFLVHRSLSLEHAEVGDASASLTQRVVYLQRYEAALDVK